MENAHDLAGSLQSNQPERKMKRANYNKFPLLPSDGIVKFPLHAFFAVENWGRQNAGDADLYLQVCVEKRNRRPSKTIE